METSVGDLGGSTLYLVNTPRFTRGTSPFWGIGDDGSSVSRGNGGGGCSGVNVPGVVVVVGVVME